MFLSRFQALWMSFYSKDLYRTVATQWRGIGLLYLLLLVSLSWAPTFVRWFTGLRTWTVTSAQEFIGQLPTVIIENGVMRADPPGRHEFRDPEGPGADGIETVFLIDDTIDQVPEESDTELVALTRREFGQVRPSRGERRVWELTPAADMEVTPGDISALVSIAPILIPPVGFAVSVVTSLVVRFAQALVYAAIGFGFARRSDVDVTYGGAVRVAIVAMTPWVILRTLLWLGPWEPAWYIRWPIAIAITFGYTIYGLRAVEEG